MPFDADLIRHSLSCITFKVSISTFLGSEPKHLAILNARLGVVPLYVRVTGKLLSVAFQWSPSLCRILKCLVMTSSWQSFHYISTMYLSAWLAEESPPCVLLPSWIQLRWLVLFGYNQGLYRRGGRTCTDNSVWQLPSLSWSFLKCPQNTSPPMGISETWLHLKKNADIS